MTVAADILDRLTPVTDAYPDTDGTLTALVMALVAPAEIVDAIVRDTETAPAWQAIRDPDTAPVEFLPWLAQHVGVELPADADEATSRALISQAAGLYTATRAALITEVQRELTGTKTVRVIEMPGGDQWALTVLTRTAETPDAAAAEAAVLRQKPAGVVLTFAVSDAPFIDEFTRTIDAITATIDSLTLADVT